MQQCKNRLRTSGSYQMRVGLEEGNAMDTRDHSLKEGLLQARLLSFVSEEEEYLPKY